MSQVVRGQIPVVNTGDDRSGEPDDGRARERREALARFWDAVKRLPAYTRLATALIRDPRVPHRSRAVLMFGGAYMVSPVDLVPGVIPVVGQLDDMYVALMALRQALRLAPDEVTGEHLERLQLDRQTIDDDLGAVRHLVRIGVTDGARWGRRRLDRLGSRISTFLARRRGETT